MNTRKTTQRITRRAVTGGATAATLAAIATACGGDPSGGGSNDTTERLSEDEVEEALNTETELTFWTWVPGIEEEAAAFTEKYPAITVNVENVGQGLPQYTSLRTALTAGSGAPDLVQISYDYISSFTISGSFVDLSPYVSEDFSSKFVDFAMQQVTGDNGEIWTVPQDTGPMGLLYRADILDEYDIEPPVTWEDFREAAHRLNEANPEIFLTNIPPNSNDTWSSFTWQQGIEEYEVIDAETLRLNVNGAESKQLAEYWQELIDDGVIATEADFTDEWYQAVNQGRYAAWLVPAWGPLFLEQSAQATSGLWRAAPMPVWNEGEEVSGHWGGSTTAVVEGTSNPVAAARFAEFLNSDPEIVMDLATKRSLFPAALETLQSPDFIEAESDFYGGQQVNKLFVEISDIVNGSKQFPPFRDQDATIYRETVGPEIQSAGNLESGLDSWQERLVAYAEEQGFTVEQGE